MAHEVPVLERIDRIIAGACPDEGCLITTGMRTKAGYAKMYLSRRVAEWVGCSHGNQPAHRVLARHFLGQCPEGQEVRHLCTRGRDGCVSPRHLAYGTRSENNEDSSRVNGHHNSPLTADDVLEMRKLRREGWTLKALGARFGIHFSSVDAIVKRRTYRWLP